MGHPVHEIPMSFKFDFRAVSALAALLRERQIDIIHTHGYKSGDRSTTHRQGSRAQWGKDEEAQEKGDALVEDWARVLYCQEAYRNPANRSRVYEYDTNQCLAAASHIQTQLQSFDPQSRENIERAAKQRLSMIQYNTRNVTEVIGACRESCTKIAAKSGESAD